MGSSASHTCLAPFVSIGQSSLGIKSSLQCQLLGEVDRKRAIAHGMHLTRDRIRALGVLGGQAPL